MHDYFANEGAVCPKDVNPAEFMIDVVSGHLSKGRDWGDIWEQSENNARVTEELERLKTDFASRPVGQTEEDHHEFASTTRTQLRLVLKRASVQVRCAGGSLAPDFPADQRNRLSSGEIPNTLRASSCYMSSLLSSTDS